MQVLALALSHPPWWAGRIYVVGAGESGRPRGRTPRPPLFPNGSMPKELKVIADFYDFMLWLIRR